MTPNRTNSEPPWSIASPPSTSPRPGPARRHPTRPPHGSPPPVRRRQRRPSGRLRRSERHRDQARRARTRPQLAVGPLAPGPDDRPGRRPARHASTGDRQWRLQRRPPPRDRRRRRPGRHRRHRPRDHRPGHPDPDRGGLRRRRGDHRRRRVPADPRPNLRRDHRHRRLVGHPPGLVLPARARRPPGRPAAHPRRNPLLGAPPPRRRPGQHRPADVRLRPDAGSRRVPTGLRPPAPR